MRIEKIKNFLMEYFTSPIQAFQTRNICGDFLITIYFEDNVVIDFCPYWEYIEIFGLTTEEWIKLKDWGVIYEYFYEVEDIKAKQEESE